MPASQSWKPAESTKNEIMGLLESPNADQSHFPQRSHTTSLQQVAQSCEACKTTFKAAGNMTKDIAITASVALLHVDKMHLCEVCWATSWMPNNSRLEGTRLATQVPLLEKAGSEMQVKLFEVS